jgi:hypothetical protein
LDFKQSYLGSDLVLNHPSGVSTLYFEVATFQKRATLAESPPFPITQQVPYQRSPRPHLIWTKAIKIADKSDVRPQTKTVLTAIQLVLSKPGARFTLGPIRKEKENSNLDDPDATR